jgi:hypothetical protein
MPDDDQPQPGVVQITGLKEVAPDLVAAPGPGLVIHSMHNGYLFWGRPSFADLYRDLREATREIRPDWDLATPGLRETARPATTRCIFRSQERKTTDRSA